MTRRGHPLRPRAVRRCPAVLAVLVVLLTGCGSAMSQVASSTADRTQPSRHVTFAAVGDSLTAGDAVLDGTDVAGHRSWVPAAAQPPLDFLGGWAIPGITTSQMTSAQVPRCDVLVVLGGTNDLRDGVPWTATRQNLLDVVRSGGGGTTLLVAVPPMDLQPSAVIGLNEDLAGLAADEGWAFVDPWQAYGVRGSWTDGDSVDGVHPTQEVADAAGRAIAAAILSAAEAG